jgi:cytochrome c553
MRNLVSVALLALAASTVFAQEPPPAGSADRGYHTYMKFMCYTCHGTLGQGADRGAGPKLAPGCCLIQPLRSRRGRRVWICPLTGNNF